MGWLIKSWYDFSRTSKLGTLMREVVNREHKSWVVGKRWKKYRM